MFLSELRVSILHTGVSSTLHFTRDSVDVVVRHFVYTLVFGMNALLAMRARVFDGHSDAQRSGCTAGCRLVASASGCVVCFWLSLDLSLAVASSARSTGENRDTARTQ